MLFQAFKKTFRLALVAPILLASPLSYGGDVRGADGSGGGDALSPRIREVRSWLKDDSKAIKAELLRIGQVIQFFDAQGKSTALIKDLISKGLLEDIQAASYEFKSKCMDEDGAEHAASTLKTDLSLNPNQPHPAICINIKKLALEHATREEVIGLLFHEHSRHFGQEDTDEAGFHPIADFITERCAHEKRSKVFNYDISKAKMLLKGVAVLDSDSTLTIFDAANNGLSVAFRELTPKCSMSAEYKVSDLIDGYRMEKVYHRDDLKNGTTIQLSESADEIALKRKENQLYWHYVNELQVRVNHYFILENFLPEFCQLKLQLTSRSESQVYPNVFQIKSKMDVFARLQINRVDVNLTDIAN
jgi:hypothetical protein